jgi:DNA adenine methylase
VARTGLAAEPLSPFLRWAGGKRQVLRQLRLFLPEDIENRHYREPFAGAAALFFSLSPKVATLSDANKHLIDCYQYVRESPGVVSNYLERHAQATSQRHYYTVREQYNSSAPSPEQAARFIYLNKTCFNGIFRVNQHGEFNVPYGWKVPPALPTREDLVRASKALRRATLRAEGFSTVLKDAREGDFVYLDPPYPPLNGTSYFTHYTADRFGELDQAEVARVAADLDRRGSSVLITNADTPAIRKRYRQFFMKRLSVTRFVTCKSKKHRVSELVITNYSLDGANGSYA